MNSTRQYNFDRYLDYMSQRNLDAVIASNYKVTARMINRYFKDDMWMSIGLRELSPLMGCDRKGQIIQSFKWNLEEVIEELARVLEEKGLGNGNIGLEMLDFPARGLTMLQDRLPNAKFVDASWIIHQDIARKTSREIKFIRKSVDASEAGFRRIMAHMKECMGCPVSELMWRHYAPEVNRYGAELLGSNVSGEAWGWREDKEPVVREGGVPINFDLICGYQGLMSDIAFRGVTGEPDAEFCKTFEKSILVFEALVNSIRPGITSAEAEAVCLENIKKTVGSWNGYWAVHSVGFHIHEFPMIGSPYPGKYGDYVFETEQVFSVETIAEQAFVLKEDGLHRLGEMPMKIYRA